MRRKDKEITLPEEIQQILKSNNICRISYAEKNIPYITVMNYGYSNNKLYFHCANEGRKLNIIKSNNFICFEISDSIDLKKGEFACDFTISFRSLIGYGKMEIVNNFEEKEKALNILMNQLTGKNKWTYEEKMINGVTILCLEIQSVTGKKNKVD